MRRLFGTLLLASLLAALTVAPLAAQDGGMATVATGRLNVRDTPNHLLGRILAQIDRGESYAVTGRNLPGTWAQLDVDGTIGWANARYLDAPLLEDAPFVAYAAEAGIINARVVTGALNLRNLPDAFAGEVLMKIPRNSIWPVVGRNLDSSWAQLDVDGETGWVNARYLLAPDLLLAPYSVEAASENIPILAQIRTGALNVRHIPNFLGGKVIGRARNGRIYDVLGRNFDSSWVQLEVNGAPGWVNARYVYAPRLEFAPLSLDAAAAEDVLFARVDTGALNLRARPVYPTGEILMYMLRGTVVSVLGRNEEGTWAEVDANGVIGWVNTRYLYAPRLEVAPVTLRG